MLHVVLGSWTLFLGLALIMLGNGLQGTLLGVRASLEGFTVTTTGLVMTGYFAGFLVGSVLVPRLVRNVGHVRVFAALASLASISVLVHPVFIDPVLWTAMRLLTGFSYAGLYVVAESWLNEKATNETRGQLLSVYMIVVTGGAAAGQLLLNLSEPGGFQLFVLISILISLSLVPISLTVVNAPALEAPKNIGIVQLYRSSPLGVVGAFGTGVANAVLFGMGAVYATQLGMPTKQVAFFMTVAFLGGMLLQWPIGWLSDQFDRRRLLTAVTFLAAVCALSTLIFSSAPGVELLIVTGLFGGLMMPMYALCIAHTNDYLEPEQMVAASGGLMFVGGIGASLGPYTASLAMDTLGPNGLFIWLAVIHSFIGLFALYRMTRRASRPQQEQGAYVPITPRGSYINAAWVAEQALEKSAEAASPDGSVVHKQMDQT